MIGIPMVARVVRKRKAFMCGKVKQLPNCVVER